MYCSQASSLCASWTRASAYIGSALQQEVKFQHSNRTLSYQWDCSLFAAFGCRKCTKTLDRSQRKGPSLFFPISLLKQQVRRWVPKVRWISDLLVTGLWRTRHIFGGAAHNFLPATMMSLCWWDCCMPWSWVSMFRLIPPCFLNTPCRQSIGIVPRTACGLGRGWGMQNDHLLSQLLET